LKLAIAMGLNCSTTSAFEDFGMSTIVLEL
jgi:hypothetical protein